MGLLEEVLAHQELARQGSVMTKPQLPSWRQNLPQYLGPTVGTGVQAGLDLVDKILQFGPSPLDAGGARGAEDLAGIFREIGLKRVGGDIGSRQWLAQVQAQPNYERFKELSQMVVRSKLGNEFPIYRGKGQTDPIMKALLGTGELPPTVATTLNPNVARDFAITDAEKFRKPAYIAKGKATPEAVPGLLPKRNTHGEESELILQTDKIPIPRIVAKAADFGTGNVEFVRPNQGGPIADIMKELAIDELASSMP